MRLVKLPDLLIWALAESARASDVMNNSNESMRESSPLLENGNVHFSNYGGSVGTVVANLENQEIIYLTPFKTHHTVSVETQTPPAITANSGPGTIGGQVMKLFVRILSHCLTLSEGSPLFTTKIFRKNSQLH